MQSADWQMKSRAIVFSVSPICCHIANSNLMVDLMLEMWWYLQKRSACKTKSDKFCLTRQYEIGKGTASLALAAITKRGPCRAIMAVLTRVWDEIGPLKRKVIYAIFITELCLDLSHYMFPLHVARREVRVEQSLQVPGWSHPRGLWCGQCCWGSWGGMTISAVLDKWRQAKKQKVSFLSDLQPCSCANEMPQG